MLNKIDYLLVCLQEECAEVQKVISKSLRFGLEDRYKNPLNIEKLNCELNDIYAVVRMLNEEGIILKKDKILIDEKILRVNHYMQYSRIEKKLED